jgi:transposase
MGTDLSDAQWERIQPLLPAAKPNGRPRAEDRRALNGILCVLRSGLALPCKMRAGQAQATVRALPAVGLPNQLFHGLPGPRGRRSISPLGLSSITIGLLSNIQGGQQIGLTRRGKGSKLMLVVENQGLPSGGLVTSAQKAEVKRAEPTLTTVRVTMLCGRPRTRPKELVAAKGYDSGLRRRLRRRGIKPCIPEHRGKRPRPGRKADLAGYSQRWKVERTCAWLGNYRRLVVRYEWLAHIYLAFILVAFILICLAALLK